MGEAVVPSDSGFDAWVHLSYGNVGVNSIANPTWMEVLIKRSKCDQFGGGVKLSGGFNAELSGIA